MRQTKSCVLLFIAVNLMLVINRQAIGDERLGQRDVTVIARAYHLWESLGEQVWPGFTAGTEQELHQHITDLI